MDIQTILVAAVVLLAAVFLVLKAKQKGGSCGSGCGCSTMEKKQEENK